MALGMYVHTTSGVQGAGAIRSTGAGVIADSIYSCPLSYLSSSIFFLVYINPPKPYCPVSTKCLPTSCAEICHHIQLYYTLLIYTSTLRRICDFLTYPQDRTEQYFVGLYRYSALNFNYCYHYCYWDLPLLHVKTH